LQFTSTIISAISQDGIPVFHTSEIPFKIYSLKVAFNDIITQLERQQKKGVDMAKARIERLKKLGKYYGQVED
jgi:hypothetical protein